MYATDEMLCTTIKTEFSADEQAADHICGAQPGRDHREKREYVFRSCRNTPD
jgi:hypothetical protein